MYKKRFLTLLCALFLVSALFPFSLFATGRTDSVVLFNSADTVLNVNGTSTEWSISMNAVDQLRFDFASMEWSKHTNTGWSTVAESDSILVGWSMDFGDNIPSGHKVDSVVVDYYCDYLDPGGVSHRYSADCNVSFNNSGCNITSYLSVSDFQFIQDLENDYTFVTRVTVSTSLDSSTPTTPTTVAYVFDELFVNVDGVAVSGWNVYTANSVLLKNADGTYRWKSSDGIISGSYAGSEDITFGVNVAPDYANYNFVLSSGSYRYWDATSHSDQYTVPVSYDSDSNTGVVTWHYVENTVGHGILTLNFTTVQSDTPTYSITSENAGFSYNADTKKPFGTQIVADGQGEFTLYALPYNGKYPRYAEIYNNAGKLLSRIDMTKFDDTAFYCLLPDYGVKCRVSIVYSDEVNSEYTNGYNAGYQQGLKDGGGKGSYDEGYRDGYDIGYSDCLNSHNSEGWLDFFNGVFGSIFTNIYYVLSGIGFGGVSLLDIISVAALSVVILWFAKVAIF